MTYGKYTVAFIPVFNHRLRKDLYNSIAPLAMDENRKSELIDAGYNALMMLILEVREGDTNLDKKVLLDLPIAEANQIFKDAIELVSDDSTIYSALKAVVLGDVKKDEEGNDLVAAENQSKKN